jgi:hypothetical protein
MARPTSRRNLALEHLEVREVLSAGGPSNQAQYMLEVLNLVRTSPAEGARWVAEKADQDTRLNAEYYGVDLKAVQEEIARAQPREPLAWNAQLAEAAQGQSEDMARNGFQSHTGSDGRDLNARLDAVGYKNRTRAAENAFAYSKSLDNAMQAFLVDWGVADAGHRRNVLDSDKAPEQSSSEVGIGIAATTRPGFGPLVVTQNFGSRANAKPQLVGVVYDDRDGDGAFSLNEGAGNAAIDVTNVQTGETKSVTTWASGGYQLELDPGTYTVSARVGGRSLGARTVTLGDQNVKVDFTLKSQAAAPAAVAAKPAPVRPQAQTPKPVAPEAPKKVSTETVDSALQDNDWAFSASSINWYSSWGAK